MASRDLLSNIGRRVAATIDAARPRRGVAAGLRARQPRIPDARVPPFRITLEPESGLRWADEALAAAATKALEEAGWGASVDFRVKEIPGLAVRGSWHERDRAMAALYEHPDTGVVLDLTHLHRDRRHVMVTTAADDGLDPLPGRTMERLGRALDGPADAPAVVRDLHARLLAASGSREPLALGVGAFALAFAVAYGDEMDWRMGRGGLTEAEIARAAELTGSPPPDARAVESIREAWRVAIDAFDQAGPSAD